MNVGGPYGHSHEGNYLIGGASFDAPESGTALVIAAYTFTGTNGTRGSCNLAIDGQTTGETPAEADVPASGAEATLTAMTRQPVEAGDHALSLICNARPRVYDVRGQFAVYGS